MTMVRKLLWVIVLFERTRGHLSMITHWNYCWVVAFADFVVFSYHDLTSTKQWKLRDDHP